MTPRPTAILEVVHRSLPDGDPLKTCIEDYFGDPDGFEANRALGLRLMGYNNLTLLAEPHLARALAHDRGTDKEKRHLLSALGQVFFHRANYDGAAQIYARLSEINPDHLADLGNVLFTAGRFAESSETFTRLIDRDFGTARRLAAERGGPVTALLSPSLPVCTRLGEMAQKIGFYVMTRTLGLAPAINALLIAPHEEIVNPCLMDYWRRQADHVLCVVSDPEQIEEASSAYAGAVWYLDYVPMGDGRVLYRNLAYPELQRRWEREGRRPVLELDRPDRDRGWSRLAKLGVPEGAWFACLHVHEASSHEENVPWSYNRLRNARIDDYLPAIEAVTARGGWVVRLGDPSMTPLPPMRNVIDLAVMDSDVRTDWMDVFCCAACRFIIATVSGPMCVSWAFGVPCVGTNLFPLGAFPPSRRDLAVPKLLRRSGDGQYLSIRSSVEPPMTWTQFPGFYAERGLEIVDNSPADIEDAVTEMIDRLEGVFRPAPDDERRQAKFRAHGAIDGIEINSRVGAAFLREHPFLIEEDG